MIHHGDLFDVLPTLTECSVDACVTDPPYGLGFMGKEWDSFRRARNPEDVGRGSVMGRLSRTAPASGAETDTAAFHEWCVLWSRDVWRVLKPGAHMLAFGGTRTFHRLTCGIEDAGFEIRDCLSWLYGSGFPKSLNLGDGRGTALKPAWEPVILARKPLRGTVEKNVGTFGTGAINVDACRIGDTVETWPVSRSYAAGQMQPGHKGSTQATGPVPDGRWPANVLFDEDAAELLDEMSGQSESQPVKPYKRESDDYYSGKWPDSYGGGFTDSGGASRFFYVAKPSRAERDKGTHGLEARQRDDSRKEGNPGGDNPRNRGVQKRGNHHPTVKPVELMRYLVRLVTPPGGTVLDPFTGSGTTGMACRFEGVSFIGIEREADYVQIAERRIADCVPLFGEHA